MHGHRNSQSTVRRGSIVSSVSKTAAPKCEALSLRFAPTLSLE